MIFIAIGLFIGFVLGLTGAGGSLFAVPLLVLFAHFDTSTAISLSLGIVGFNALFGSLIHLKSGNIQWPPAIAFLLIGSLSSPLGAIMRKHLNETVLLLGFTGLVIFVAARLWQNAVNNPESTAAVRANSYDSSGDSALCPVTQSTFKIGLPCILGVSGAALTTGVLSGLFGVGGGFIIVPALILITGINVHQAVATSLVIISAISLSAFTFFIQESGIENFYSLYGQAFTLLIVSGFAAMFTSKYLSRFVTGVVLQKAFSLLMVIMSAITIMKYFM